MSTAAPIDLNGNFFMRLRIAHIISKDLQDDALVIYGEDTISFQ